MKVESTLLTDVYIFTPRRFEDERGWFSETWNEERMRVAGFDFSFAQDNHSFSSRRGTLRGLHYQNPPHAQNKIVRCTQGAILDIAVDIRKGSPAYGKWAGVELSAENGRQLLIPRGFLHGFVTLANDSEVQYKCTDIYVAACDGGIRWNDPDIGIDWGLGERSPTLSAKDEIAPLFAEFESPFSWKSTS